MQKAHGDSSGYKLTAAANKSRDNNSFTHYPRSLAVALDCEWVSDQEVRLKNKT